MDKVEAEHWLTAMAEPRSRKIFDSYHFDSRVLDEKGVIYATEFTGEESFLVDHRVHGRKILPGVVYIELAYAAIVEFMKEISDVGDNLPAIELSGVSFIEPGVIESPSTFIVSLLPDTEKGFWKFKITTVKDKSLIVFSEGRANVALVLDKSDSLAVSNLEKMENSSRSGSELYKMFRSIGVEYGETHKTVKTLFLSQETPSTVFGDLKSPSYIQSGRHRFYLHPSLMDGALQTSMATDIERFRESTHPIVPFWLERVRINSVIQQTYLSVATKEHGGKYKSTTDKKENRKPRKESGDVIHSRVFDIALYDSNDILLVEFSGFQARPYVGEYSGIDEKRDDNPFSGELCLTPRWEKLDSDGEFISGQSLFENSFFICNTEKQINTVKKYFPHSSGIVITGDESRESIADRLSMVRMGENIVWLVPELGGDDILPQVQDAQRYGVLFLYRLIKVFIEKNFDALDLYFTVISQKVFPLYQQSNNDPRHASITGFLGSLAKEYEHWNVRHVDVDLSDRETSRSSLLQCLMNASFPRAGFDTLVLKNDCLYKSELLRTEFFVSDGDEDKSEEKIRTHGTYVIFGGAGGLGLLFSEYLIKKYKANIVWVGRRPYNETIKEKANALSRYGAAPLYFSLPHSSELAIRSILLEVKEKCGSINGVIHSALVLDDSTIASMEEDQFLGSLQSKIDLSVAIALALRSLGFEKPESGGSPNTENTLDFLLFFSSLQNRFKAAGQSNYASGSTFVDGFSHYLNRIFSFSVKTINWGYWGDTGIVATDFHRARMASLGINPILPTNGIRFFEQFLSSSADQMGYIDTTRAVVGQSIGLTSRRSMTVMPSAGDITIPIATVKKEPLSTRDFLEGLHRMQALIDALLLHQMMRSCRISIEGAKCSQIFVGDYLDQWVDQSLTYLSKKGLLEIKGDNYSIAKRVDDAWEKWIFYKENELVSGSALYVGFVEKISLVDIVLKCLPEILSGSKTATQVLFPDGQISLVEGLYKNNTISDFYNHCLADALIQLLKHMRSLACVGDVRILEVGAGSGGTSEKILKALKVSGVDISEYCYTDVSSVFLNHAELAYKKDFPYLKTKILDITQTINSSEFDIGGYDFVVATNVLHACSDVSAALMNVKSLLKPCGHLLLNEAIESDVYLHCTFGLLEGWWLFEDSELRLPGSPILSDSSWCDVLLSEGFRLQGRPADKFSAFQQQVYVAQSDGLICIDDRTATYPLKDKLGEISPDENYEEKSALRSNENNADSNIVVSNDLDVKAYLRNTFASVLDVENCDIGDNTPFSQIGVDSILVLKLVSQLRQRFPQIDSALLFDHNTVDSLARYLQDSESSVSSFSVDTPAEHDSVAFNNDDLLKQLTSYLASVLSSTLNVSQKEVVAGQRFSSLGLDSILVLQVTNRIKRRISNFDSALLFDAENVIDLARQLIHGGDVNADFIEEEPPKNIPPLYVDRTEKNESYNDVKKSSVSEFYKDEYKAKLDDSESDSSRREDIAIVGLCGRYAEAKNLAEFWRNIQSGKNCIGIIPESRWSWQQFHGSRDGSGDIYTRWGGFMPDADAFDPLFFGISPLEAERMDPQERVFLECAYSTIEDAGYTPAYLAGNNTGVFVGVMNNTYQRQPSHWSVANRVSFSFDFDGPSFSIDTACSSSLTAIHIACNSIRSGECTYAIAGGVNIIVSPEHYKGLTEMNMLSESDKCRSFGDGADGFVDGEGVGAVLLKPLQNAIADGDHIYGVIRGSAINHGGRTNGYTVPSPSAQKNVIVKALQNADVKASEISYVEAHGTGTSLGDPIEVSGLTRAFLECDFNTSVNNKCALGSLKSNIGHCESAAGIAGVTKVLLQMKHKQLVPSLHSSKQNENINFDLSPFNIQQSLSEWKINEVEGLSAKRIAGISSFGAGGANAHLIIEEYTSLRECSGSEEEGENDQVFVISAKTEDALRQKVLDLLSELPNLKSSLASIVYTLQVGRENFQHRLACVVSSKESLGLLLESYLTGNVQSKEMFTYNLDENSSEFIIGLDKEDQQALIEKAVSGRQLYKLAKLWSRGFDIEWSRLHSTTPCRVSLPSYPFSKEHYWTPVKFYTSEDSCKNFSLKSKETPISEVDSSSESQEVLMYAEAKLKNSIDIQSESSLFSCETVVLNLEKTLNDGFYHAFSSDNSTVVMINNSGEDAMPLFKEAISDTQKTNEKIRVVYLWPAQNPEYLSDVSPILSIIQALREANRKAVSLFICSTASNAREYAYQDALDAFGSSISLVAPGFAIRVIGEINPLALMEGEYWFSRLGDEFTQEERLPVTYDGRHRYIQHLRSLDADEKINSPETSIRQKGTYLITGGFSGAAQFLTKYLVETYQTNLVLCGRSQLDAEKEEHINNLTEKGASVRYICADVSDIDAMRQALSGVLSHFGVIDGVFHLAGVDDDISIFDKTASDFERTLTPKVKGALVLDELLLDQPLDFVMYFSSLSALLGDLGGCAYAMANRFLLSYAGQREKLRLQGKVQGRSYAIAWPLMDFGKMKNPESEQAKLYLKTTGQSPINNLDAINVLESTLRLGEPCVVAVKGNRKIEGNLLEPYLRFSEGLDVSKREIYSAASVVKSEISIQKQSVASLCERPELIGLSAYEATVWDIKEKIQGILKIDRIRLDVNTNLSDFGFDSITMAKLASELSQFFNIDVTPAVFFTHTNIDALARHFLKEFPSNIDDCYALRSGSDQGEHVARGVAQIESVKNKDINTAKIENGNVDTKESDNLPPECFGDQYMGSEIAIVGISGRFSGAKDLDELWEILVSGKDVVQEIPQDRFDWRDFYGDPTKDKGKTNGKWMGVLPGVKEFDPRFFEILPTDAEYMDPRQRILMQETWRALEDAGIGEVSLKSQRVGMFVGVEQGDYQNLTDEPLLTSNHDGILASRLAYYLDFNGPTMAINTACSSGLVAAHEACLSLKSGECDTAIAAAANILTSPEAFVAMGQAGMLSDSGKCKAFSEDANGIVPGEAVVAMVFKRLDDAKRDGDPIYGVIRGSGINYDGKTNGITAPSGLAQEALLSDVYSQAKVTPGDLEYIVTHGTGTKLGDPVEINALYEAFNKTNGWKTKSCAITSTKSNLGHTFAASGLVNLAALLLSMRNEVIPASLHCQKQNNYIPWESSPFYVNKENKAWPKQGKPRLGAVSAFGMSGTNAHMVVESFDLPNGFNKLQSDISHGGSQNLIFPPFYLFVFSAKSKGSLRESVMAFSDFIGRSEFSDSNLNSVSCTLLEGRHHFPERIAIVASGVSDLRHTIGLVFAEEKLPNVFLGSVDRQATYQEAMREFAESKLDAIEDCTESEYRNSLLALADLYCQGYSVNWNKLFKNSKPGKCRLPGYVFERNNYWVVPEKKRTLSFSVSGDSNDRYSGYNRDRLHPLVHSNVSTLYEQSFVSQFYGEEFFFSEHVIREEKILPGAALMEIALAVTKNSFGQDASCITLQNISFIKPLICSRGVDAKIKVCVHALSQYQAKIEVLGDVNGMWDTLSKAEVSIRKATLPSDQSMLIVADFIRSANFNVDGKALYEIFSNAGFQYGSSFQGIENLYVAFSNQGEPSVLAELKSSDSIYEDFDQFDLHPGMLDSALQASMGLFLRMEDGRLHHDTVAGVPYLVDSVNLKRKINRQDTYFVHVLACESSHAELKKANVYILNSNGEVCVDICGFASRAINSLGVNTVDPHSIAPNSPYELTCFYPSWQREEITQLNAVSSGARPVVILVNHVSPKELIRKLHDSIKDVELLEVSTNGQFVDLIEKLVGLLQSLFCKEEKTPLSIQVALFDMTSAEQQGVAGLLKSLILEYPRVQAQTVSFPKEITDKNITALLSAELTEISSNAEVSYRNDQRFVNKITNEIKSFNDSLFPWRDNAVYLVSGGMGGIGYHLLLDIVSRVNSVKIIVIGRTEINESIQEKLRHLHSLGSNAIIEYASLDVCDEKALYKKVFDIKKRYGGLHGVVHSAGLLNDSFLRDVQPENIGYVISPKVVGVENLDRVTSDMKLDFFVTFSSLSSLFGNVGQSIYASANGFMNGFIEERSSLVNEGLRYGKSVSIAWPLWKDGGMQVDEEVLAHLKNRTGVDLLETDCALLALYYAMSSSFAQIGFLREQEKENSEQSKIINTHNKKEGVKYSASKKTSELTKLKDSNDTSSSYDGVRLIEDIVEFISEQIRIDKTEIDIRSEFSEFGFDSISLTTLANTLNECFNLELSPTLFFEYPSISKLSNYLLTEYPEHWSRSEFIEDPISSGEAEVSQNNDDEAHAFKWDAIAKIERPKASDSDDRIDQAKSSDDQEAIAIVGMSGSFPNSPSLEEFWENISSGIDCIGEIPESRWRWIKDLSDDSDGLINAAGVIDDIDQFDPLFFGISPREAETMDPTQRLLMMHVWKALEDSAHAPESLAGSNTALFIGTGNSGYSTLSTASGTPVEAYTASGMAGSLGPNRLSYFLDLHGPSEPIETACSSSLVAIHRAVTSLRAGHCDQAIAGGVNVLLSPEAHISFAKAGMLAPDGRCKTFSKDANGYVRGEGVGILVLKPLSKAEADGDQIYALVKSTSENHGGRSNSLTAPNPRAQADLIKSALRDGKVDPNSIGYIEAHGTGTSLGDPIEIQGLKSAFSELSEEEGIKLKKNYCGIGSVKTNIGHLELASGVASVIKVLLQLKHKTLAPSLYCDNINPYIKLANSPFKVISKKCKWEAQIDNNGDALPRRAGISSFGFGGVNAHIVLEEYIPKQKEREGLGALNSSAEIVVLSARSQEALRVQVEQLSEFISGVGQNVSLADLAFTLREGRDAMDFRWACVARSMDELFALLKSYSDSQGQSRNSYQGHVKQYKDISNLFSGDADLQKAVASWVDNSKLDKICDLWTKGLSFDWHSLNAPGARRISAPSYPFSLQSYWFELEGLDKRTRAVKQTKYNTDENNFSQKINLSDKENTANKTSEVYCFTEEEVIKPLKELNGDEKIDDPVLVILPGEALTEAGESYVSALSKTISVLPESSEASINVDSIRKSISSLGISDSSLLRVYYMPYVFPSDDWKKPFFSIWKLLHTLYELKLGCMQITLCVQSKKPLDNAYFDAWVSLERSLKISCPDITLSVLVDDQVSELNDGELEVASPFDMRWWSNKIVQEYLYGGGESAIYRRDKRYVYRCIPAEFGDVEGVPIKRQGTYLITGGLGGIGEIIALDLAGKFKANLIICGRSALDSSRVKRIKTIEQAGGEVFYFQADVSNRIAMQEGINKACDKFGVIDGVFHAAGVSSQVSFFEKSFESFCQVVDPKICGALILDEITVNHPLDFMCYFSSSSAILGDVGACDYAFGNRFLLSYVNQRERQRTAGKAQGNSIVVAWPLWANGGMGLGSQEQQKIYLASSGQSVIENDEGMACLYSLLCKSACKNIVFKGASKNIRRFLGVDNIDDECQKDQININSKPMSGLFMSGLLKSRPEMTGCSLDECALWDLKNIASNILKIDLAHLNEFDNLSDFGFDSIGLSLFSKSLSDHYGVKISPSLFFSYSTLGDLRDYYINSHAEKISQMYANTLGDLSVGEGDESGDHQNDDVSPLESKGSKAIPELERKKAIDFDDKEPIAIIGISGRFPGARNTSELWDILNGGKCVVSEIPKDRFDWKNYYGDSQQNPSTTSGKWLGVMPGVSEFDPKFFEISPAEAEQMDPRQRILLQEAWRALEDAALGPKQLQESVVGMFVGAEQGDYHSPRCDAPLTANHDGILASRLAYMLNLRGPALAINTACSSGLVAAHQACLSLRAEDCDTAIVAGVNILTGPEGFIAMGKAGMLSDDGKCHVFSSSANGMVPAESVVAIVLKRLGDAERDRDPIYGVIRGSGVNYDGKTNGITAPSGKSQSELIRQTYECSKISPNEVEYLVTHGTGTRLGDPVEINALNDVFKQEGRDGQPYCALTSNKSNLGHSFAASGLVNVTNLLLAMKNESIPASLHCDNINDYIEWQDSPLYVNTSNRKWSRRQKPRVGAVSAFGMSGTNAHMVIESYDKPDGYASHHKESPFVLLALSAKTESSLADAVEALKAYFQVGLDFNLASVSYTLLTARHHFKYRIALVVQDVDDAINSLAIAFNDEKRPNIFRGDVGRDFKPQKEISKFGASQIDLVAKQVLSNDSSPVQEGLFSLAELYCQGHDLEWEKLFKKGLDERPKRLHLPTYSFSRESYWIDRLDLEHSKNANIGVSITKEKPINPFIHHNTSTSNQISYTNTYHGDEFFLKDHVIKESKVMPGVAFIEMVRSAICDAIGNPEKNTFHFQKVVFLQAFSVDQEPKNLDIMISPDDRGHIEFYIVGEDKTRHVQGQVIFLEAKKISNLLQPEVFISKARMSFKKEQCYEAYKKLGLHYGETFQGIEEVFLLDNKEDVVSVIGKLKLSSEALNNEGGLLHPSLIDAGLQASIAFVLDELTAEGKNVDDLSGASIPFEIKHFEFYSGFNFLDVSYVYLEMNSSNKEKAQSVDGAYLDSDGNILLSIEGFNSRRIDDDRRSSERLSIVNSGSIEEFSVKKPTNQPFENAVNHSDSGRPDHFNVLKRKLESEITKDICDQLKVKPEDVDPMAEFSEFGYDSVSLTTLGNTLNAKFGIDSTPTMFFEYPTLRQLCDHLLTDFYENVLDFFPLQGYKGKINSSSDNHERIEPLLPNVKKNSHAEKSSDNEANKKSKLSHANYIVQPSNHSTTSDSSTQEPVAIIGVSGKFPMADDLEQFWLNLASGRDCISEIPDTRWDWASIYGDPSSEINKTNIKSAGIISGIDQFDPLFFGISPREAEAMDPQQRLLMTYIWKVIEDAGYAPGALSGTNTGIFVGTGASGYGAIATASGLPIEGYSAAGMVGSIGPNRMSFLLNLHGPSEPIETACSSSLVAIHRAVSSILRGECDQAIVGGVNTLISPESQISFNKAGMLSKDGRCKTFSKHANGYVRGEGVGMLMLKPLSAAETDGDQIYALIRGSAENHGGRSNSLTAPNPRAQADLIKKAVSESGIDARSISYIEAHGTGTSLGDPIEIRGLKSAYSDLLPEQGEDAPTHYCGIGSVKTNIGHLELAAGVAGIIKVLLQMKHQTLVPTLHCDELNPYIDLERSPFRIVSEKEGWNTLLDENGKAFPRRAGVSSFGFGGVNAHVVLEEYLPKISLDFPATISRSDPAIIVLSAKTEERLMAQLIQLNKFLDKTIDKTNLNDLAFTLQVGRDCMRCRWACVSYSLDDLLATIKSFVKGDRQEGKVFKGEVAKVAELPSFFQDDGDFYATVKSWIQKKKYENIAELWVKGGVIDWHMIYEVKPRRLSLPTYPFDEKSYWYSSQGGASVVGNWDKDNLISHRKVVFSNSSVNTGVKSKRNNDIENRYKDPDLIASILSSLSEKNISVEEALKKVSKE